MCFNDYIKYIYNPIYIYNIYIYIDYILYEFKPLNITKSQNVFMYKKNVSSSLLITVSSL